MFGLHSGLDLPRNSTKSVGREPSHSNGAAGIQPRIGMMQDDTAKENGARAAGGGAVVTEPAASSGADGSAHSRRTRKA